MSAPTKNTDEHVVTSIDDPKAFACIIENDEMAPRFIQGDRVTFEPSCAPKNGDAVLARTKDRRVFFRYFKQGGSLVTLTAPAGAEPELCFNRSEFDFIYRAGELFRHIDRC